MGVLEDYNKEREESIKKAYQQMVGFSFHKVTQGTIIDLIESLDLPMNKWLSIKDQYAQVLNDADVAKVDNYFFDKNKIERPCSNINWFNANSVKPEEGYFVFIHALNEYGNVFYAESQFMDGKFRYPNYGQSIGGEFKNVIHWNDPFQRKT